MTLPDIECTVFADRCQSDPQGVIRDLVAQTTRQGKAIRDLTEENKRLAEEIRRIQAGKPSLLDAPF